MTAYYVLGAIFVLFALGLTAIGLTRDDFPPTRGGGRALMAVAGLIAIVTFGVLLATTEREHPREEAAEKAAEEKAAGGEREGALPELRDQRVVEDEYSIKYTGGVLRAGETAFEVVNEGQVPHDLAVEGVEGAKTPLIDGGKSARLVVQLDPGDYKLICTVPGHEQLGMSTDLKVGG